jgi:catechol 2,3-dioxygenase-like lactoylglutathione lyase family enzyme
VAAIEIEGLDHLVLTVGDVERACQFYQRVLGLRRESFGKGRVALYFGRQKINLHPHPTPHDLVARQPAPGTADLCFLTETPLSAVAAHLEACGVEILAGPVERSGAEGPIFSLYCRDPDGNLIEIANRAPETAGHG